MAFVTKGFLELELLRHLLDFEIKFIHLSMRRTLSGLLFVVLLIQIVGVATWFELSRREIRKEIKSAIKSGLSSEKLHIFTFSKREFKMLRWIKSNEFERNGRLYDVVRTSGDSEDQLIVQCIDDIQERTLFASLGQMTANDLGSEHHQTPLYYCIKLLKTPAVLDSCEILLNGICLKSPSKDFFCDVSSFSFVFLEKETPPPNILG